MLFRIDSFEDNADWNYTVNVFCVLDISDIAVEYVDLKGDIVLFNAFTILFNILIITNENKFTSGAGLLSWFPSQQFEGMMYLLISNMNP